MAMLYWQWCHSFVQGNKPLNPLSKLQIKCQRILINYFPVVDVIQYYECINEDKLEYSRIQDTGLVIHVLWRWPYYYITHSSVSALGHVQ